MNKMTLALLAGLAVHVSGLVISLASAAGTHRQSPPRRFSVNTHETLPRLKQRVAPVYPKSAASMGIQGTVRLHAVIARDGSVRQITPISGPPELVQSAIDAVQQWQYYPIVREGRIIEVETTIDVLFQLQRKK
jgi:TonB family protein